MEKPRSLPRSFSIKPTRLLLLSSTISSSLLFCFYYSFWLLDNTPSGSNSAAYFQLIGGLKTVEVHPSAAPNSIPLADGSGSPITAETLVTVIGNPSLEALDVGNERNDEILSDVQMREAGGASIEALDSVWNRLHASGGDPGIFEDKNSTDLPDVNLEKISSFSDEVVDAVAVRTGRENSEFDARDMEEDNLEADVIMSNRSSHSSLGKGKVSLVENAEAESASTCDVSDGRWVFDESYPLYKSNSCPFVDEGFSCEANGRMDKDFMKWRWEPNGCSIPRFNPVKMLELIRGKRLVFVGDSINRNQWESMLCMLRTAIPDPSRVYEARGQRITKNRGNYNFKFPDYDCSVEYYVSHHLVRESKARVGLRRVSTLRIDSVDRSSSRWRGADVLVFNSAHWWSHHKTKAGVNYYQEGNLVHRRLDVSTAFRKALSTWALWVDQHVSPGKTQVFFRSSAPSHFSGGEWNSGGHCKESILPLNDTYVGQVPAKNIILEQVVKQMKTPVTILNITNLSGLRIDGHPSIYGRTPGKGPPTSIEDCSHWCLPGVPDTWNEFLYFHLLLRHKPAFAS